MINVLCSKPYAVMTFQFGAKFPQISHLKKLSRRELRRVLVHGGSRLPTILVFFEFSPTNTNNLQHRSIITNEDEIRLEPAVPE